MASIDWTRDEAGRIAMEILAMTTEIAILMQEMTAIITTDPVRWRALQRELVDIMRQRAAVQQLLHRQRLPAADTRS